MSIYTTERIELREFREEDATMVFRLLSNENVLTFTTQSPMTKSGAHRFVEQALSSQLTPLNRRNKFELVVEHERAFVGRCFLHIT